MKKSVCSVVLVASLALTVGPTAAQLAPSTGLAAKWRPSPLEAHAKATGAEVIWSHHLGTMEGQRARLIARAIVARNPAASPDVLRGIKLGLEHVQPPETCQQKYISWSIYCAMPDAAIYLEENGRLERALDTLSRGLPFEGADITTYAWRGGGGTSGGGVLVGGYEIEGSTTDDLVALLRSGVSALAAAPR